MATKPHCLHSIVEQERGLSSTPMAAARTMGFLGAGQMATALALGFLRAGMWALKNNIIKI